MNAYEPNSDTFYDLTRNSDLNTELFDHLIQADSFLLSDFDFDELDQYEELLDDAFGFPPKLPDWLTKLIKEIENLNLNLVPIGQFVSGMADEFFVDMDLEEFDKCYTGAAAALPYIQKAA